MGPESRTRGPGSCTRSSPAAPCSTRVPENRIQHTGHCRKPAWGKSTHCPSNKAHCSLHTPRNAPRRCSEHSRCHRSPERLHSRGHPRNRTRTFRRGTPDQGRTAAGSGLRSRPPLVSARRCSGRGWCIDPADRSARRPRSCDPRSIGRPPHRRADSSPGHIGGAARSFRHCNRGLRRAARMARSDGSPDCTAYSRRRQHPRSTAHRFRRSGRSGPTWRCKRSAAPRTR